MSCKLLVGLAMVCGLHTARAERAVTADVPALAPFDAQQLAAALRLRLPVDGPPVRVRVSVLALADGVRVEARGSVREIALGGLAGESAARLVALVLDDLLLDDLVDELAIARGAGPSAIQPRPPRGPALSVLGGAAAWQHALGGVAVELAIPIGRGRLAIEAGGGTLIDGPLQLTTALVRIGGGLQVGLLELRGGATLVPVIVSDGAGDETNLIGAGASARLRVPINAAVHLVLAAGADVFATRTTYVVNQMAVLSTPWMSPWLALGVEVVP